MRIRNRSSLLFCACLVLCMQIPTSAETIIKLGLGGGPDLQLSGGFLSTVGNQPTDATFHGFVGASEEIQDIVPPKQASFELNGVALSGDPSTTAGLITQATMGGSFALFDETGAELLRGTLVEGALHGTTGNSATGGFLTANLGTFTGPTDMDKLFKLLEPDSASLAISLTDVRSSTEAGPVGGFAVVDNVLQTFTADATAAIAAEPFGGNQELPEPSSFVLALVAGLAALRLRRRARGD